MKEILSTKVILKAEMTMSHILALYKINQNYNGNIYMIGRKKVINPNNLPKLVSFFLTSKSSDEIKIVVQGTNAHLIVATIEEHFKPKYKVSKHIEKGIV